MSTDKQNTIKDGNEANLERKPAAKKDRVYSRIYYEEDEETNEDKPPPLEMRGEKQSTIGVNKPTKMTQSKRSRDKEEEEKVEIKGDAPDDAVPDSAGMPSSTSFEEGPEAKPRTRGAAWTQPQYPGAVAIDGFDASDVEDGTVVVGGGESENENPAPNDEMHLAQANLVEDPLLVSATEIKCLCCPYGGLTAVPAVFACLGFGSSIFAPLVCFADYIGTSSCLQLVFSDPIYYDGGYIMEEANTFGSTMGLLSGSLGAIASIVSIVLSCHVVSARLLTILGVVYIVLGVLSLLMLVELGSESCKLFGCTFGAGAGLAIGAFFAYVGAGISTFHMIKKKQFNHSA